MAADGLGVKVLSLEIRGPTPDVDGAFRTVKSERAGALIIPPGPALILHRKRFLDFAAKSRLPAMYGDKEAGGLMSYGTDYLDLLRWATVYVVKILKGTKAVDLPVEQPTKFVINLKTAKQMGLTIPPNLLTRADRVIR